MMKTKIDRLGLFLLFLSFLALSAVADEGRVIQGTGYEGVILTPNMVKDFGGYQGGIFDVGVWTPSRDLVRKAEARLPKAIAERALAPKVIATYNVPRYFTSKAGNPVGTSGHERLEDDISDSVEQNNFLYDVRPNLKDYKRQYVGVTAHGKKLLLINFVHPYCFDDDYVKRTWRHEWVAALDAGDLIWDVRYNPSTGAFSEWNG